MKTEIKLNSEQLFELPTLEINSMWRKQYFFSYCIKTTVYKSSNFNISTGNAIQKKLSSYSKWTSKFKVCFY